MGDTWNKIHHHTKKCWHFFWHSDSGWSWLANTVVAFLVIRFMVYPLLAILLGTPFPIVAVVSESMEHRVNNGVLCGKQLPEFPYSLKSYWNICGKWYEEKGISLEQFQVFPFHDGFDKGDVIVLWRANHNNLRIGNILVFKGNRPQPIIHRVVKVTKEDGNYFYQTKGDHNSGSIEGPGGETAISEERILGQAILRIPYLGWIKIGFVNMVKPFGITIVR